ncbi:hypothetical protein MHU86_7272 [Fragilaria crotonensis]|nr:hypothetical protein MHU86_7272 [Fragilaria crotonensis]
MAPDVFSGEDAGTWPQAELAALYNCKLASATSAREGAPLCLGCHHFNMPPTCWILDPTCDPVIDVIIAIDDEGIARTGRLSLAFGMSKPSTQGLGDVGSMHALGTNITKGDMNPVPYATNRSVHQGVLRDMVVALHSIGKACFPDVLGVILGLEADSGLEPVQPMNGDGVQRVGYRLT